MARNNNLTDFLTDVADAIRAKKGTTGLINPQNFSSEIESIISGSICSVSQITTGVYSPTSDTTLINFEITGMPFRPKIFLMRNADAITSNTSSSPYNVILCAMINNNDYSTILYTDPILSANRRASITSFVVRASSTVSQGGTSDGNSVYSSGYGVKGIGSAAKFQAGKSYTWVAFG